MTISERQDGDAAPEALPSLTLAEYVATAGRAIRQTLPAKAWVEAVILDVKARGAGLNIELVEPLADTKNNAFLRCFLNERVRAQIEDAIRADLDADSLKGCHARLLLKPGFHPRYHLQGEVLGLDPTLVESLVARRLEGIRQALRNENLYGAQARLSAPRDVTSIAVVHPEKSAGWADVEAELTRLQDCGILTFSSFPTPFEGPRAASGIIEAIRTIGTDVEPRPDLILIIRGGGAAAGLAGLADVTLAKAICRCPIPIVTGLGHASDQTFLDEIAWRSADTPSKALGIVKTILRRHCESATVDHRAIVTGLDRLLAQTHAPLLKALGSSLVERTEKILARQFGSLREQAHQIQCRVIRFQGEIANTQNDLDRIASGVLALAPGVPRKAAMEVKGLHRRIVRAAQTRLPPPDGLGTMRDRQNDAAALFLQRRRDELASSFAALEALVLRRLGDELSRLRQTKASVEALDATATLRRGYVLPLDTQGRIIRSATAARAADRLALQFVDGMVACRPVDHP